jgi:hypothetical protein
MRTYMHTYITLNKKLNDTYDDKGRIGEYKF